MGGIAGEGRKDCRLALPPLQLLPLPERRAARVTLRADAAATEVSALVPAFRPPGAWPEDTIRLPLLPEMSGEQPFPVPDCPPPLLLLLLLAGA